MEVFTIVALVVCVAGLSLGELSQSDRARIVFNTIDANDDNRIVLHEMQMAFDGDDRRGDHDGRMNYHEFATGHNFRGNPTPEERKRVQFVLRDTVGGSKPADGYMDRSDLVYFYNRMDINGDGHGSLAEFTEEWNQLAVTVDNMLAGAPVGK